jgi:tetratricopeptide (TPR) repeat protein
VNLQPTDFDFLCQELVFAIDYFATAQKNEWHGRANHCLAYLYLFAGNVSVAHKHSAAALQLISVSNTTNEADDYYAHILRLHAVTLSLLGDYTLARNQLKQALVAYQQTFRTIEVAQTYMRLAMNELFARDLPATTNYLYITLQEITKSGNAKSVLYCIDIYIVLLCFQGNTTRAYQLFTSVNGFRSERGVSRGAVFDQLIEQYFAHQTIIKSTLESKQSLSDVLSQITEELNARIAI